MKRAVLLYMPVIHKGYLDFLRRNADLSTDCFLVGVEVLSLMGPEAEYLVRKDAAIRGLPADTVCDFVRRLDLFKTVSVLSKESAVSEYAEVWGPDEEVTFLAAKRFFPGVPVQVDTSSRLRYDRRGVDRVDPIPPVESTIEEVQRMLMGRAIDAALRSNDWWLSVGALVARGGQVLFTACNKTMLEGITGVLGDPRSLYSRGESTDDTLAHHAERSVVSQAARAGTSLEGADAYVTHFPCVPCASSLIEAGIQRIFFQKGYSRLESASLFEAKQIEIVRVIL